MSDKQRQAQLGSRNNKAKLTENDIHAIRARFAKGDTNVAISLSFGVTRGTISKIRHKHQWAHIPDKVEYPMPAGAKRTAAKLKRKDIPVIRRRLNEGHTQAAIAKDYGVTQTAIALIKSGKTWGDIPHEKIERRSNAAVQTNTTEWFASILEEEE